MSRWVFSNHVHRLPARPIETKGRRQGHEAEKAPRECHSFAGDARRQIAPARLWEGRRLVGASRAVTDRAIPASAMASPRRGGGRALLKVSGSSRGPNRRNLDSALLSIRSRCNRRALRQTLGKKTRSLNPLHGRVFVCITGATAHTRRAIRWCQRNGHGPAGGLWGGLSGRVPCRPLYRERPIKLTGIFGGRSCDILEAARRWNLHYQVTQGRQN
jgi:hypothetical protein